MLVSLICITYIVQNLFDSVPSFRIMLDPSVVSNHAIDFVSPSGVPSGGSTIVIDIDPVSHIDHNLSNSLLSQLDIDLFQTN